MLRPLIASVIVALCSGAALAHFVYIVPQPGEPRATVILSEGLVPDAEVPLERTLLHLLAEDGQVSRIEAAKSDDGLAIETPGDGPRVVFGTVTYGVRERGNSGPFMLFYHPKAVIGPADPPAAKLGERATLEIIAQRTTDGVRFVVLSKGKPLPDAPVTIHEPDLGTEKVKTDEHGRTPAFTLPGRYALWTRLIEDQAGGEFEGQRFNSTRHYATLVVDVAANK